MTTGRLVAAAVFFHALFATVNAANQRTAVRVNMRKSSSDFREIFNPPTMLLLSSPMERKVSYTQIKNFKSVGGVVLPLIDAGLLAPSGLAWDSKRSALYIADAALRKIFRVKLEAFRCREQCKGMDYQLKVTGNRYTMVEGVISQWVAVDGDGNLFYSDQETNSVNKLPKPTIDLLIKDRILPKDIKITTEAEAEGEESAKEAVEKLVDENATKKVADPEPAPPQIFQLYEGKACANVGTPAGLAAEGHKLYWTNQVGGFSKGSLAEGSTLPTVKEAPEGDDAAPSFPSVKIANNTGSAYGVALTTSKILYTDTGHTVWAASRGNGEVVPLTTGMLKPRGIVWDGDNTAYIADEEGNTINSIPVGLLKEGAPISHAVDIHAPFGLEMLKEDDPIWEQFKNYSGARQVTLACVSLVVMLVAAM